MTSERSGGETAQAAQGLAESAGHDHLGRGVQAEVLQGAPAGRPPHPGGVGVVDDQQGVLPPGRLQQLGHRGQVAVHGKHPVGDQQLDAVLRPLGQ